MFSIPRVRRHGLASLSTTSRPALFDKILVANRGEIACRVFRTAKKLGIQSVAVFSEADKFSKHARMADEAYCIGPAPSQESYLNIDRVLAVIKRSGAQAVHPGYGFLSENSIFAEALADAGVTFIGPPTQALKDMGSKSASKNIMTEAGVPVVPGYHGEEQDPEFLRKQADKIGYPIMIKAVLGGGGKGMRIVRDRTEFSEMLTSAKRESLKSFSDDRVLLERYIQRPRHIEVQIFGDQHGNAVYLYERDCSVQRRHQKILEEAPAPELSEAIRRQLGETAVKAAKAVNYVGAGTVEFIFDCDTKEFYFMEMNTRLQVEHPVTEMITGLDLVHWQLLAAAGNKLPLSQEQIGRQGHAVEARIYAENTENNFMPDVGRLAFLHLPEESEALRVETGVRQGDEISVFYDPMIAKVIAHGTDRADALAKLHTALRDFNVVGVRTNISLIRKIIAMDEYRDKAVDTSFIATHSERLFARLPDSPEDIALAAVLNFIPQQRKGLAAEPWGVKDAFGNFSKIPITTTIVGTDRTYRTRTTCTGRNQYQVQVQEVTDGRKGENERGSLEPTMSDGDRGVKVSIESRVLDGVMDFIVGDRSLANLRFHKTPLGMLHMFLPTGQRTFQVLDFAEAQEASAHAGHCLTVVSPMPCRVSQVVVSEGQKVEKGSILMVVEAMKMEHVIKAPAEGTVKQVLFREGDLVGEKKTLLELE